MAKRRTKPYETDDVVSFRVDSEGAEDLNYVIEHIRGVCRYSNVADPAKVNPSHACHIALRMMAHGIQDALAKQDAMARINREYGGVGN